MDTEGSFGIGTLVGFACGLLICGALEQWQDDPCHQETLRLIATGEAEIKPHAIAPDGTVMEWQLVPVNPNGKELK
jgi:hypothetical protein